MIRLLIALALITQLVTQSGCTLAATTAGSFFGHLAADIVYDEYKEKEKEDVIKEGKN